LLSIQAAIENVFNVHRCLNRRPSLRRFGAEPHETLARGPRPHDLIALVSGFPAALR
jgi:hypothetical protein